jgi:hypothetical protein
MAGETLVEHWLGRAREQLQRLPPFACPPVVETRPANGWLADNLDNIPRAVWLALWPLGLLALVLWYLRGEHDRPIRYRVPSAHKPDREEIISKPSTKVGNEVDDACLRFFTRKS